MKGFRALHPPSRPGEFHPESLTEPYVSLSTYTARATHRRLPPSARTGELLRLPVGSPTLARVTHPLCSTSITLASSLLRGSPPLSGASILSASRVLRLCLFSLHRRSGSQVPHESPDESHASCTPDTAWPVSRFPPCSSRGGKKTPVSMSSEKFRCLNGSSLAFVSLIHT